MEENTAQEQPIVEIFTKIDREEYERYARFVYMKGKSTSRMIGLYMVFLPIYLALIVAFYLGIKSGILNGPLNAILIGVLSGLFVIMLLFLLIIVFSINAGVRTAMRSYEQNQRFHEADSHETFYEDFLLAHKEQPEIITDTRIGYNYYSDATETESAFYLTIAVAKNMHGVFPKSCMTPEQVEALRALFARKYGDKFKGMK